MTKRCRRFGWHARPNDCVPCETRASTVVSVHVRTGVTRGKSGRKRWREGDGDELPNEGTRRTSEAAVSDWNRFRRGRPSRRPLHSPPLFRPPTPFREMPTSERANRSAIEGGSTHIRAEPDIKRTKSAPAGVLIILTPSHTLPLS